MRALGQLFIAIFLTNIALAAEPADSLAEGKSGKPRLLVLTDIGGDPDDQQSMIRLMVYANEFEIEGLIATASGTSGELKERVTRPDLIREIVTAYGQVQPNLAQHAPGFPRADYLLARIKSGNPQRGREAVGGGRDTEASRWIISCADKPDERPLNITIWGGQTDLAQALWRVRQDRRADGLKKFIGKIRIYDIGDQDRIFSWVWQEFPGLWYVLAKAPPGQDMRQGAYRGMYLGGDESLTSRAWIDEHVRKNHGPLGALYPTKTWTAPNPHGTLKEGDTPSWFFFLPNGLGDPAHPEWGSWGGRFTKSADGVYRDAADTLDGKTEARLTVSRWRPAFQNDFAARMDWCVKPPGSASHAPWPRLRGEISRTVAPGEKIVLDASDSQDPAKGPLTFHWFVYPEAGTCREPLTIDHPGAAIATVKIPQITAPATIHIILALSNTGNPPLTSYRRVILNVQPQKTTVP